MRGYAGDFDFSNLAPTAEDINSVKQFESLAPQQPGEAVKQYEYLEQKTDSGQVKSYIDNQISSKKDTNRKSDVIPAGASADLFANPPKQPYVFYLFSGSMPDVAIGNVFIQALKLDGLNFRGVLRGVDDNQDVIRKLMGIREQAEGITIAINPLVFKYVGAQVVPAFVFAHCPTPAMFRSAECDFDYVVYGDMSLLGALEIIGRENKEAKDSYDELRNAF